MPLGELVSDPAQGSQDKTDIGIEERRSLITAYLDKVVIRPAPRPGTHRFDPTRISVVTRAGEVLAVEETPGIGMAVRDRDGRVRLTLSRFGHGARSDRGKGVAVARASGPVPGAN